MLFSVPNSLILFVFILFLLMFLIYEEVLFSGPNTLIVFVFILFLLLFLICGGCSSQCPILLYCLF